MGCRRFAPWGDESSDDNDDDSRVSRHPHLRSHRAWSYHPSVPTDQKVDWQQGGSRQINTTGHSTPLTITSVQLNGTGRPVLVHRISVRDEEVAIADEAPRTLPSAIVRVCLGVTTMSQVATIRVHHHGHSWTPSPRSVGIDRPSETPLDALNRLPKLNTRVRFPSSAPR